MQCLLGFGNSISVLAFRFLVILHQKKWIKIKTPWSNNGCYHNSKNDFIYFIRQFPILFMRGSTCLHCYIIGFEAAMHPNKELIITCLCGGPRRGSNIYRIQFEAALSGSRGIVKSFCFLYARNVINFYYKHSRI